jgi:paraquat-inducible protein A
MTAPAPHHHSVSVTVPPVLLLGNIALLALYPTAWAAPLVHAGFLPFLSGRDVSIFSGILSLWDSDRVLAALIALLGVAMPLVKTLALSAVHLGWIGPSALPTLEVLGKLSMADVFLLAVTIVVAKGVGIGRVEPAWGLHLFAFSVLASMAISHFTKRSLRNSA